MNAVADPAVTRPMPHVMNTYGRLPIALSHGKGCWVWDTEGRRYLDALGGIAVNTLGHGHPKLVPALQDQVAKLIHSSNYYEVPLQEQLAATLCELSGLDSVFFCSTGLEANEGALKIARKYGHDRGISRPEIIVYEKAFHGRSIATLSATGNPKVFAGGDAANGGKEVVNAAAEGRDAAVAIHTAALNQTFFHQLVGHWGDVAAGHHHAARQRGHLHALRFALELRQQIKARQGGAELVAQTGAHLFFNQLGAGEHAKPQSQGFGVLAVGAGFKVHGQRVV